MRLPNRSAARDAALHAHRAAGRDRGASGGHPRGRPDLRHREHRGEERRGQRGHPAGDRRGRAVDPQRSRPDLRRRFSDHPVHRRPERRDDRRSAAARFSIRPSPPATSSAATRWPSSPTISRSVDRPRPWARSRERDRVLRRRDVAHPAVDLEHRLLRSRRPVPVPAQEPRS